MRKTVRATFLSILSVLMISLAAPAEAADTKDIVAQQGKLCFARVYDPSHLKSHSRQKMERLFVMIAKDKKSVYWDDPALRGTEESPKKKATLDPDDPQNSVIHIGGVASFRGAPAPQEFFGSCTASESRGKKGSLDCGMECDRGLGLVFMRDEKQMNLDEVPSDVFVFPEDEEKGDAATKKLMLGADDKSFRLEPRPLEECITEANKTRPPWAQFGPPLRERLKPDQPFCLGRDYAPEHLVGHPKQVTASVRIWRSAKHIENDRAKNLLPDWPDQAGLSVATTTRANGKPVRLDYVCSPDGDQWGCYFELCQKGKSDCAPEMIANTAATHCDKTSSREIFLRRGAGNTVMLSNPSNGLPIDGFCRPDDPESAPKTQTDDRFYRLEPMPLSACETF